DCAKLLGRGIDAHRGSEAAVRSRERIRAEEAGVLVAAVEQIAYGRKQFESIAQLDASIEADDGVGGKAPVTVAVVLVAARVLTRRVDRAGAERPARVGLEIEPQFQRI